MITLLGTSEVIATFFFDSVSSTCNDQQLVEPPPPYMRVAGTVRDDLICGSSMRWQPGRHAQRECLFPSCPVPLLSCPVLLLSCPVLSPSCPVLSSRSLTCLSMIVVILQSVSPTDQPSCRRGIDD
eukprot:530266-Hanusia_phi.AAC.2